MPRTAYIFFAFNALFLVKGSSAQPMEGSATAIIKIQDAEFFSGNILDQPHTYTNQGDTLLKIKLKSGPTYITHVSPALGYGKIELTADGIRIEHPILALADAILHFQIVRKRLLSRKKMEVKIEGLTIPSLLEIEFKKGNIHYNFYEKHNPDDFRFSFSQKYLHGDEYPERFNITEAVNGLYEPIWLKTPDMIYRDSVAHQIFINRTRQLLFNNADSVMIRVFGKSIFKQSVSMVSASSSTHSAIGFMENDTQASSAYFTYKYANEEAKAVYFVKFGIDLSGKVFYQPNPILNYQLVANDFEWVPTKQVEDSMVALFPKIMLVPKKTRRGKKLVKNDDVDINVVFSQNPVANLIIQETKSALTGEWKPKFLYMVEDNSQKGGDKTVKLASDKIWYFDTSSGQYLGYVENAD